MSRGDYADALQSLLEAGSDHWLDAAYVAERVLTLDELTGFANRHVPSPHGAGPAHFHRPILARLLRHAARYVAGTAPAAGAPANARAAIRRGRWRTSGTMISQWTRSTQVSLPLPASMLPRSGTARKAGRASSGLLRCSRLRSSRNCMAWNCWATSWHPTFPTFGGETTMNLKAEAGSYSGVDENSRVNANPPPEVRFHYRGGGLRSGESLRGQPAAPFAGICRRAVRQPALGTVRRRHGPGTIAVSGAMYGKQPMCPGHRNSVRAARHRTFGVHPHSCGRRESTRRVWRCGHTSSRWWFWPWLQWSEAYLRCAGGGFVRG